MCGDHCDICNQDDVQLASEDMCLTCTRKIDLISEDVDFYLTHFKICLPKKTRMKTATLYLRYNIDKIRCTLTYMISKKMNEQSYKTRCAIFDAKHSLEELHNMCEEIGQLGLNVFRQTGGYDYEIYREYVLNS